MKRIQPTVPFKIAVWTITLAMVVFTLVSPLTAAAAKPLPSHLSNAEFWSIVTAFSEEGGYFRFENFLSNELAFQVVIPALKERTKPEGVYLGVGPEQNFTYVVALHPKIAFIFDIRRQNMIEHLMYKAIFELSSDRADFLSRLYARKRPEGLNASSSAVDLFRAFEAIEPDAELGEKYLREIKDLLLKDHRFVLKKADLSSIEYIYRVFVNAGPALDYAVGGVGGGWGTPTYADLMMATDGRGQNRSYLATEENFMVVREMEKNNLIVPLVGDFAGPKAIRAVAHYLKEHDATVTAFYTSNVEQYLFQQGEDWRRFYTNVEQLPLDSSSTFIRSVNGNYFRSNGVRIRFQSVLSPMQELLDAFEQGVIRYYGHVVAMSQ